MTDLNLFPTASALSKIEDIYGEIPSEVYSELYTDICINEPYVAAQYESDVVDGDASMSAYADSVLLSPKQGMSVVPVEGASQTTPYISIYERSSTNELSQSLYSNTSLTNPNLPNHFSRNTTYEHYLKEKGHNSDPIDYLTPHIQQRKEAIRQRKSEILDRKAWFEKTVENIFRKGDEHSGDVAATDATSAVSGNSSVTASNSSTVKKKYKVHMYSQQTHNLKAMILEEMRLQLASSEAEHNKSNKGKGKSKFTHSSHI